MNIWISPKKKLASPYVIVLILLRLLALGESSYIARYRLHAGILLIGHWAASKPINDVPVTCGVQFVIHWSACFWASGEESGASR